MKPFETFNINEKISVLYVEDQLDIQEEFVEILELYVDEINTASNGQEGLDQYQKSLPDIIITDIQMPLMSGLEMVKKIRQRDQEIPIIITSAFEDSEYLLEAIGLGVEHYLLKPVVLNKLQDQLELIKKRIMQKRELEAYQLYLEDRIEEEVALGEAKEALLIEQNKSSEVGQMVSVIAHQWKQPLHYLNLLIEDLGMEYEYQPLSKEYIQDFIQKGTDRVKFLSETMDNFLSFYKSETKAKSFSISKVAQEISLFLDMSFKSLGIHIEIIVKDDFSLHGIENEFQQVILNLVNNAKEAFDGQKRGDAKISVEISTEKNKGVAVVQDNAGGIPSTEIGNIFHMDYTTKEGGNGIGLYLVKKIVEERFNGSVEVSNTEEGARFVLRFELNEEEVR
jgi:YesN/AraC family two-component response regulator